MNITVLKHVFIIAVFIINVGLATKSDSNNRPIIGILTQEVSYKLNNIYLGKFDSYIAASYVKYVESAGARTVPIWIGQPESYYRSIMSKINGVLFPGGSTFFNQSHGYADAGEIIYRIANEFNKNNDYFPIWGTCLGFELLTYLAADRYEHRVDCNSNSQALPLQFTPDFQTSRLFKNAPTDVIQILGTENVTANFHRFCVTKKSLKKANISDTFRIISVNRDLNNQQFVSSLEHFRMPYYGVQFHPEKNNYEWITGKNIPHTSNAIKVSQYFANFFVNEARKNHHKYSDTKEENEALMYNYLPAFTGLKGSAFVQCYLFKSPKLT